MVGYQIWTTGDAPGTKHEHTPTVLHPPIFISRLDAVRAQRNLTKNSYLVEYPIVFPTASLEAEG
jgi:hypothetical protein